VEESVDFLIVSVVKYHRLQFAWLLGIGIRCVLLKQRDVENIVLLDRMQKVYFGSCVTNDLTYLELYGGMYSSSRVCAGVCEGVYCVV
jgi:hypothetical protein